MGGQSRELCCGMPPAPVHRTAAGQENSLESLLPLAAALCVRLIKAINSEWSNCRHLVGDFMIIVLC